MTNDRKREIWAWCWYDFANSAFTTVIVTVAYSVYFAQVVARGRDAEAWWGWGYGISMLLIGIASPVLGAMADFSGTKKKYLAIFTVLSVAATALLAFVAEGDVWAGIVLFAVANIGFNGGLTFYNAFLKDLSRSENMGRISGYGFALGYIGGLASLILVYPMIRGGFDPDNLTLFRLSFPVTAVFFLVFSIPALIYLREDRGTVAGIGTADYIRTGFERVWRTFHEIRKFRELFKFFVAYLIYIDGVNTVIVFSAIFAAGVLGFTPQELVIYFIVMQVTSAAGAYAFGHVTDRIGAKPTIIVTLLMWIALIVWAFFVGSKAEFYALGLIAGVALGSNQSASRTLLGLFAPRSKVTEFFGFFALTGKFAATVGPPVYGVIASSTGNQRWAVLSIGAFYLVGLLVLTSVRQEAGIAAAEAADRAT
jgi:UMF1 family MFS transporter